MEIEKVKKNTKKKAVPSMTKLYEEEDTNAEEILRERKTWAGKTALTNDNEEYTFYVANPHAICELCSMQFEDEEAYQIHIISKRHKRNVQDTLTNKMRILEQMPSHKLQTQKTMKLNEYTTQKPDNFECEDHKKISAEETLYEISERYTKDTSMFISWDILTEAFARIDLQISEMVELHKNITIKSDDSEDKDHEKITQDFSLQSLKEAAVEVVKSEDSEDEDDRKITQDTSSQRLKKAAAGLHFQIKKMKNSCENTVIKTADSEFEDHEKITQDSLLQSLKKSAAGVVKSEDSGDEDDGKITQDTSSQRLKKAAATLHLQVNKMNLYKSTVTKIADSEFEDNEKSTKTAKANKIPKNDKSTSIKKTEEPKKAVATG